jgi:hypothetical protein
MEEKQEARKVRRNFTPKQTFETLKTSSVQNDQAGISEAPVMKMSAETRSPSDMASRAVDEGMTELAGDLRACRLQSID